MEGNAVVGQTPCESLACKTIKGILYELYSSELQHVGSYEDDRIEAMFCVFFSGQQLEPGNYVGGFECLCALSVPGKLTDSSG